MPRQFEASRIDGGRSANAKALAFDVGTSAPLRRRQVARSNCRSNGIDCQLANRRRISQKVNRVAVNVDRFRHLCPEFVWKFSER